MFPDKGRNLSLSLPLLKFQNHEKIVCRIFYVEMMKNRLLGMGLV